MIETYLKPFSHNHSIREAVVTIFLGSPIIKPERFQELITKGLGEYFHLFENVNAVQIQIKPGVNGLTPQQTTQQNAGFRFVGFNQGKIGTVFQGINELERTFMSYHSFGYKRWAEFLDNYLSVLSILSQNHEALFIRAVSIHYIDEFTWVSQEPLDLNKIFNDEAKYMSKAFLDSSNTSNFIYTTEKKDGSSLLFDRLDIKVDNKITKNITISHNILKQFDDFKSLSSLLDNEKDFFLESLQKLHNYNKEILNDILNDRVKTLINLPNQ
ncbi:TIGR04255 family protein [Pedobacter polaris]|uniref:TIGR04255 family protein n=1 Tax=Pedobacter polaris TaxID=2571273 RepID=A0A4U1CV96_9SPHI|nr:TIGR04255 family protein [Pedobacter polaris]TKC13151.1 TIGR04255 family protein [Pedobacter polaris]